MIERRPVWFLWSTNIVTIDVTFALVSLWLSVHSAVWHCRKWRETFSSIAMKMMKDQTETNSFVWSIDVSSQDRRLLSDWPNRWETVERRVSRRSNLVQRDFLWAREQSDRNDFECRARKAPGSLSIDWHRFALDAHTEDRSAEKHLVSIDVFPLRRVSAPIQIAKRAEPRWCSTRRSHQWLTRAPLRYAWRSRPEECDRVARLVADDAWPNDISTFASMETRDCRSNRERTSKIVVPTVDERVRTSMEIDWRKKRRLNMRIDVDNRVEWRSSLNGNAVDGFSTFDSNERWCDNRHRGSIDRDDACSDEIEDRRH